MNTGISGVKANMYFPMGVNNVSRGQEMQTADSFTKVFDKTQNSEETVEVKTNTVKDKDSIQNHANIQKNRTSENLKEQTKETKSKSTVEETEKVIQESADTMVETIAEMFDVSVEEVESVLETLGLTALDLLNSENLTQVVLALNPDCDAMTLMTNEELFADLKTLMNTAQELKGQIVQDFQLSEEDLAAVLEVMKEKSGELNAVETENVKLENVKLENVETDVDAETLIDVAVETTFENVNAQTEAVKTEVPQTKETTESYNQESSEVEAAEPVNGQEEIVVQKTENSQTMEKDSSNAKGDSSNTAANTTQNFAQNLVNQLAEAVENVSESNISYGGVRGQDILNQIKEQIRVHVAQDTTEMELQLHPASLGNVKVQIASTNGVLTAVFTTENEAVKAALESQLVQLKENFTEQGLKVESVEVNVSAQAFERSLDQQEQEQNRFENQQSKRGSRRIRLNALEENIDGLFEDMSDGDKVVADMMIRNGNTVDYMV